MANELGLTSEQAAERVAAGRYNKNVSPKTKSVTAIFASNVFTIFNLINIAMGILIMTAGLDVTTTVKNCLFLMVILWNTGLGIVYELRSKRTIDKLEIISSTRVRAMRDGKEKKIRDDEVVLDDVILFSAGDRIVADCILNDGRLLVDESLLTGESDPEEKHRGDRLFGGSFVISGSGSAIVDRVGEDCYSASIVKSAKVLKKNSSDIMKIIFKILTFMGIVIIPIGLIMFCMKYFVSGENYSDVIVSTGGAVVSMLPEGLVLLTTTVFALGAVRLARHRVVSQDLYSAESLARVDVLCLDKTGTLTTGEMTVESIVPLSDDDVSAAVAALNKNLNGTNATDKALKVRFGADSPLTASRILEFNSSNKYSAAYFDGVGSLIIGAPDIVAPDDSSVALALRDAPDNLRALLVGKSDGDLTQNGGVVRPIALILLRDVLRDNASQTLTYFEEEGVIIKIISGDNEQTVRRIARDSGVIGWDKSIDMSQVSDDEIADVAENYFVFARVTPEQKKMLICALKANGHYVGMTGDGVNDVMALHEADCSIAMASGTDAAKNVSQLVLLDSNFDALPHVVKEGRRTINNFTRSSTLFLVKTMFSTVLSVLFLFIPIKYPFSPIQLTLVSALCIGAPSTFLALEPDFERIQGSFISDILKRSVPAGTAIICGVLAVTTVGIAGSYGYETISTMCVICAAGAAYINLFNVCRPFNWYRGILFTVMLSGFILGVVLFSTFFSLLPLSEKQAAICAAFIIIEAAIYYLFSYLGKRFSK